MFNVKYGYVEEIHENENYTDLIKQITQDNIRLIMFFVPGSYEFTVLAKKISTKFPDAVVLGSNSGGQLIPGFGYAENKIAAFSISADDFEVECCLIPNIKRKAMLSKDVIKKTAEDFGLHKEKGFGLLFIDGLSLAEEKVLMAINSAIPNLPIVGGSSSDNWEFKNAHISLNGVIHSDSAILLLIKTNRQYFQFKENIYQESEYEYKITEIENPRCIGKLNDKPAAEVYAETLGCTIDELPSKFMQRPVGRIFGKEIWITTPTETTENGGVVVFANVAPNTKINILKSLDPVEVAKQTATIIKENVKKPQIILGFNCMMRHLQFKNEQNGLESYNEINNIAPFLGLSTYGEQMNNFHCNQTLTLIVVGE